MSFEFLSSFPSWEENCLRGDHSDIDRLADYLPLPADGKARWTEFSQLLNTLSSYEAVRSIARDGQVKVGGFSGLLKKDFARTDPSKWLKLCEPSPEQMGALPAGSTLLRVEVGLLTPFFSKDDTAFYPTDNVLRRDRLFELPFLSAAGLKGLLRWAHRMASGSLEDDDSARFLYGLASDEGESRQGALHLWPLIWRDCNIGLDVINPQNRDTGAGTVPVKYEVVEKGGKGTIWLMLVPPLGDTTGVRTFLPDLLRDLQWLVEKGGLSAKQTAGWGALNVLKCNACIVGVEPRGAVWKSVMTDDGQLKPYSQQVFTTSVFASLLQELEDWSASRIKKENKNNNIARVYAEVEKLFEQKFRASDGKKAAPAWYWPEKECPKDLAPFCKGLLAAMKEEKAHG